MGLGKSLQTIAFLHTFFAYYPDQRSLLLVPSNVVHNWDEEFHHWLPQGRPETDDALTPTKVESAEDALCSEHWEPCAWGLLHTSSLAFSMTD